MVPEWFKGGVVYMAGSGLNIPNHDTSESMNEYNWPLYLFICCKRSVVGVLRFKKRSHREETYLSLIVRICEVKKTSWVQIPPIASKSSQ